jgi:hypothetical protein
MQQTPDTDEKIAKIATPAPAVGAPDAVLDAVSPAHELSELLHRASALAASLNIDLDGWMKSAWSAYVDAQPGLREHLEEMQLLAQLTQLRQSGRIGQA